MPAPCPAIFPSGSTRALPKRRRRRCARSARGSKRRRRSSTAAPAERKRSIARSPPSMPSGARAPRRSACPTHAPPPAAHAFLVKLARERRSRTAHAVARRPVIAVFGVLPGDERLSGPFIGHDGDPEIARSSPGGIMVRAVVADAISRGFAEFDLGVGEARYKDRHAKSSNRCSTPPSPSRSKVGSRPGHSSPRGAPSAR